MGQNVRCTILYKICYHRPHGVLGLQYTVRDTHIKLSWDEIHKTITGLIIKCMGVQWLCVHARAYVSACVCACAYLYASVEGNWKKVLGLELQAVVSCPTWALGTELGSLRRAARAFNCRASLLLPPASFQDYSEQRHTGASSGLILKFIHNSAVAVPASWRQTARLGHKVLRAAIRPGSWQPGFSWTGNHPHPVLG